MIDEAAFEAMKEQFDAADELREAVIKQSRDVLKLSKQAIYSIHRDDLEKAAAQLQEAKIKKGEIEQLIGGQDVRTGSFSQALEEYVEAAALFGYVNNAALPSLGELGVKAEEYLLGLADLTGELMRRAVVHATKQQYQEVEKIHELLEGLYGQFVKFDFRNGDLRRKYDSIKYNLQKVENILYERSLKHG